MKTGFVAVLVIVALIIGAAWWATGQQASPSNASEVHIGAEAGTPRAERNTLTSTSPRASRLSAHTAMPGRALDIEARLRPLAAAGDAEASFQIYLKLVECAQPVLAGVSEHERAAYRQAGVSAMVLEEAISNLQSDCEGAQELVADRGVWLDHAAKAGHRDARLLFAADPDSILGSGQAGPIDANDMAAYAVRSEEYMTTLAAAGDVDAMLTLSLMYKDSQFMAKDAVRSAAYRLAAEANAPLEVPSQPSAFTMRGLDAQQQAQAFEIARDIRSGCCGRSSK